MTIARNPRKKQIQKKARGDAKAERQARKFITPPAAANGSRELVPVLIKFDRAFLDRTDAAARGCGLNRSAFVIASVGDRLMKVEEN